MKDLPCGPKPAGSAAPIDQIVVPPVGWPASSVHVNAAPPQGSTSTPRCVRYQSRKAAGSLALKKMPPMPVTRFMGRLPSG